MPNGLKVSSKTSAHVYQLASKVGVFLCILFFVGWVLSILPIYFAELEWRMAFSMQLLERSHLPLIGFAIFALSLNFDTTERKYPPFVYWKRLKIIASAVSLIYLLSLGLTIITGLALVHAQYEPLFSKKDELIKLTIEIDKKTDKEELINMFKNAKFDSEEMEKIETTQDLNELKSILKDKATRDINAHYQKIENAGKKNIDRIKLDAIKYGLMGFMYMIMYLYLYIFFNRLYRQVHPN